MRKNLPLIAILLAYILVGNLYAALTPDWQAPDEPAHYNYIRQLANGRFPIMTTQDYDEAYRNEVISSGFAPQYDITTISYQDYQPPLYYLLQTPIFWLSNGNLKAMRLFAVLLGTLTLSCAYLVAQQFFRQRWLSLTAVAFIAFLPQHVAIQASLNNDDLSELLIAAMLVVLLRYKPAAPQATRHLLLLGLLLGLALLTKVTAYLMAPVIGLVLLWHHWPRWPEIIRHELLVAVPSAVLATLWWGRNLAVYGWPDFLGIEAHDAAVVGQLTTSDYIAQNGLEFVIRAFFRTTFQSFWGQFGWMGVVMPSWIYQTLMLFSALVLLGFMIHLFRPQIKSPSAAFPLTFLTLLLLNITLYLTYNLTYVQHQARYLFASLIPITIGVTLGSAVYFRPLTGRWPHTRHLLPLGLTLGLLGLDLLALFRFIIPALTTTN